MLYELIQWINECTFPFVLTYVAVFTLLAESAPVLVTKANTNAYTSQISWNVTLKSLKFQLVNYIVYHEKPLSIIVHAVTFLMDIVLWTIYFHHLLSEVPFWAYNFLFVVTFIQVLTFEDDKLKFTLLLINFTLMAWGEFMYSFLLLPYIPRDLTFGAVSIMLFLNAFLRVISHIPERIPINFYGLGNKHPISNWWSNPKARHYILTKPHVFVSSVLIWGFATELQAGLPIRLLSSCLLLITDKLKFKYPGLDMVDLYKRADRVVSEGWHVDEDGRYLFEPAPASD
ncbi:hypothetical protein AKO1_006091 [Acrasis kona]|uniref:Uncharacterized protein n=1 Tax=Acrasis kona TaxID=1008807 RepID=A0AAW2YHY2_9EUKA